LEFRCWRILIYYCDILREGLGTTAGRGNSIVVEIPKKDISEQQLRVTAEVNGSQSGKARHSHFYDLLFRL
jgi:hypothetical protein